MWVGELEKLGNKILQGGKQSNFLGELAVPVLEDFLSAQIVKLCFR